MCDGMNYPRLQWEPVLRGDFVCPDGVEGNDLMIFSEQWLALSANYADIAPVGAPDGKVNMLDYCVFAENWLLGID
jgi:hypothetical protein